MKRSVAALLLLLLVTPAWAQTARPRPKPDSKADAARVDPHAVLRAMEDAFSSVADRVTPAVVNVSAVPDRPAAGNDGEGDERFRQFFGDDLYERYFKRRPREDTRATGSGVIVDPKGYILTNNHVIENARDITVRLSDSRKFPAKLVGRDPKTDLAVLKVDAPAALPVAELADSDRLRVGQWAIAIGNPFGLDRTVTVGIISATARNRVGVATYENFIQTDASINPGNSGGPLLNLDGKVIGINTAIVASGQGIGFSIPINEARAVMGQLISSGRVVRGWLGIVIQDVTDELAGTFGVREREGVLVADVMKGGPADSGGLRPGDVVVDFGGTRIREVPDLQRRVANVRPGQAVKLVVVRDNTRVPVTVTVGEMPAEDPTVAASESGVERFGLRAEPLTSDVAERLGVSYTRGVVVVEVAAGSPAAAAGLRRGDLILEVARRPIADPSELAQALTALPDGEPALLYVHRPGADARNEYVVLNRTAHR
ncbi:MAG TPA: Do family serine endopeptidase [Methylomirabilota bacterium]|nr:Do family serine endopeptidase [Methylomirabilota bacterium]